MAIVKVSDTEFKTLDYRLNGEHLARISQAAFNRTPVNDTINEYEANFSKMGGGQKLDILWSTFGDPARYPGIGTHRGFKRFERRCSYFMSSGDFNGYMPSGYESLKSRIREGYTLGPQGSIQLSAADVGVYITPGVAGALRLICDALIFPPVSSVADSEVVDFEKKIINCIQNGAIPSSEDMGTMLRILADYRRLQVSSNVVIPMWTYSSHLAEVFRAHGKVNTCQITPDGQIDLDSLEKSITPETRAVIFATVGNPLCTAMEPERFDKLLAVVRRKMDQIKKPILVVADTIYEHFRRKPEDRIDPVRRAKALDNGVPVIDTSSFSKMMVLAGARVGFIRHFWPQDSFPEYRHDFLRAMELLYWPTLCPVASQPQIALGELYSAVNRKDPVEEDLAPLAAMLTALKYTSEQDGKNIKSTFFSYSEVVDRMHEWGVGDGFYLDSTVATQTRKFANKQLQGYAVDVDHEKMAELINTAKALGIISVEEINGEMCMRLDRPEMIPDLPFSEDGQLSLIGLAKKSPEWREFAKKCGIKTEDEEYQQHKDYMTRETNSRTDDFVDKILAVPGVKLHPALVDANGVPIRDRFNAFYVLWAFEGLMMPNQWMTQGAKIADLCIKNNQPIIATVPGELFLPPELRGEQKSYVRHVTLNPPETNERIRKAATVISPEAHW